jgi:penicillin-insensitive murein endopeptidase
VRPDIWSEKYIQLYKTAAQDPEIERVLANPAIKRALCRDVKGDRSWLHKVRPVVGHNYHFHVRIGCPKGSTECKAQPAIPDDDGCGKDLDWWFTEKARNPPQGPGRKPLKMSQLPPACKQVLLAP